MHKCIFGCRVLFPSEECPLGLHVSMFIPTLETQGSDEQKAKWLQKALDFEIIGTYAQTELGHGICFNIF